MLLVGEVLGHEGFVLACHLLAEAVEVLHLLAVLRQGGSAPPLVLLGDGVGGFGIRLPVVILLALVVELRGTVLVGSG